MSEKLYTEAQMRQCFLAGFSQAMTDPVRCRPSEYIDHIPVVQAPVVPGVDICCACGRGMEAHIGPYHRCRPNEATYVPQPNNGKTGEIVALLEEIENAIEHAGSCRVDDVQGWLDSAWNNTRAIHAHLTQQNAGGEVKT